MLRRRTTRKRRAPRRDDELQCFTAPEPPDENANSFMGSSGRTSPHRGTVAFAVDTAETAEVDSSTQDRHMDPFVVEEITASEVNLPVPTGEAILSDQRTVEDVLLIETASAEEVMLEILHLRGEPMAIPSTLTARVATPAVISARAVSTNTGSINAGWPSIEQLSQCVPVESGILASNMQVEQTTATEGRPESFSAVADNSVLLVIRSEYGSGTFMIQPVLFASHLPSAHQTVEALLEVDCPGTRLLRRLLRVGDLQQYYAGTSAVPLDDQQNFLSHPRFVNLGSIHDIMQGLDHASSTTLSISPLQLAEFATAHGFVVHSAAVYMFYFYLSEASSVPAGLSVGAVPPDTPSTTAPALRTDFSGPSNGYTSADADTDSGHVQSAPSQRETSVISGSVSAITNAHDYLSHHFSTHMVKMIQWGHSGYGTAYYRLLMERTIRQICVHLGIQFSAQHIVPAVVAPGITISLEDVVSWSGVVPGTFANWRTTAKHVQEAYAVLVQKNRRGIPLDSVEATTLELLERVLPKGDSAHGVSDGVIPPLALLGQDDVIGRQAVNIGWEQLKRMVKHCRTNAAVM